MSKYSLVMGSWIDLLHQCPGSCARLVILIMLHRKMKGFFAWCCFKASWAPIPNFWICQRGYRKHLLVWYRNSPVASTSLSENTNITLSKLLGFWMMVSLVWLQSANWLKNFAGDTDKCMVIGWPQQLECKFCFHLFKRRQPPLCTPSPLRQPKDWWLCSPPQILWGHNLWVRFWIIEQRKKHHTWGHWRSLCCQKGGQFLHLVVGFSRAGKFWHLVEEQAGCQHGSQN